MKSQFSRVIACLVCLVGICAPGAQGSEEIGVLLVARQAAPGLSPAWDETSNPGAFGNVGPGDLMAIDQGSASADAKAFMARNESTAAAVESFWAGRTSGEKKIRDLNKELKKKYGKKKKWPPEAVEEMRAAELELRQLHHETHMAINSQAEIDDSLEYIQKYIASGDFLGPGKVESPMKLVDSRSEAHWVLEVEGRYRLPGGQVAVVCLKGSPGDRMDPSRLAETELTWSKAKGHRPTIVHEYCSQEPYWVVEAWDGVTTNSWRTGAAAAVAVFDKFVTANREKLSSARR